jgi:hypothetical protein
VKLTSNAPSIPSPVELSGSDDDGFSLSQQKLAIKKQMAYNEVMPNSTSGSDEDEEKAKKKKLTSQYCSLMVVDPALCSN